MTITEQNDLGTARLRARAVGISTTIRIAAVTLVIPASTIVSAFVGDPATRKQAAAPPAVAIRTPAPTTPRAAGTGDASTPVVSTPAASTPTPSPSCLTDGAGLFRARVSGTVSAELNWKQGELACSGSARPGDAGIRLTFGQADKKAPNPWVFILGIGGVKEGQGGSVLPANVTLMRETTGDFFSTQGDGKCTVDRLRQTALTPAPLRIRHWRVTGRGFCTQPALAVRGTGSVLVSRFDFVGQVEYTD